MKTKKIMVEDRKFNPETGEYLWTEREETKYVLEDEDRMQFVFDILRGETTPEEIVKKYQISSVNSVYSWIGKYVSQNEVVTLQPQIDDDMANKSKDDQIRELKAALKQANKKAELEELRAKAYDKMIGLAEETFNIPIRKKSGTKQ